MGAIIRKLENTIQKNFLYINDYYTEIKINLDIYSIYGVTKTDYSRRFEENFNRGLRKYTYNEIIKKDFKDVKKCLAYFQSVENKIIGRSEEIITRNLNKNVFSVNERKYDHNHDSYNINYKWCKWHKKCSHETKDCFYNNNNSNNNIEILNKKETTMITYTKKKQ
ncbi:hypothetical protein DMUE_2669 [Dictyocoela muelleri]|nr:hypothetical protein DMUE_2669 [Dictyocoela muelleri]